MQKDVEVRLGPGDRKRLEAVAADRNSAQKHVWRAQIILATAEGCGTAEIMRRAGVCKPCVWRWQRRFMEAGVDGLLHDKTRKPGKAPVADPVIACLIARDRTQPGLPMKRGRAGAMTHDYIRNGTTTLFAALNVLDGTVIGQCMQRHRHQEFIRFLNRIERDIPAGRLIHVILDNYGSHKHPKVRAWLARHPRWSFHFTPTSASWLNAVEGFFAKLTRHRLKRGVCHSLVDLQAAINRYLAEHNNSPRPFTWTADPDRIIAAASRGYQVLDSIH